MKRLLLIATALLALTSEADAGADGCAVVLRTPDGFLNLRYEPKMGSIIVGRLKPGELICVHAETMMGKWTRVSWSRGAFGWSMRAVSLKKENAIVGCLIGQAAIGLRKHGKNRWSSAKMDDEAATEAAQNYASKRCKWRGEISEAAGDYVFWTIRKMVGTSKKPAIEGSDYWKNIEEVSKACGLKEHCP
jgi:hypothetical protein